MAATIITALADIDHPIRAMATPKGQCKFHGIIAALGSDCDSQVDQKTNNS
jgi:hypothetical protein